MGHTLRLKILSGAAALLALFACALLVTLVLVRDSGREVDGIVRYHHPLQSKAAALDVYTFELEIIARKFAADLAGTPEHAAQLRARAAELTSLNRQLLHDALELASSGSNDDRNDVADRLEMARLVGRLTAIRPDLEAYLTALNQVIALSVAGDRDGARRLLVDMDAHDSIDALVSESRTMASQLIGDSLKETEGNVFGIVWINAVLFSAAAVLGLAVFLIITGRLNTAIHRLIDAFRRTADGGDLSLLPITSADEIGTLSGSFNEMIGQLRAKQKLQESFGQFIDPRILATLVDTTTGELKHTAERRRVTISFCDVGRFSALGEQLTADALVNLLNHYFNAATDAVLAHNGIVDKFIGDAVMAFWASPFSEGELHARDGCLACLDMAKAFERMRSDMSNITGLRRSVPDFRVRLGLATGDTLVGTVGSTTKKSFTVMGDTVNLASRLEGLNKVFGTQIILNEECARLAERDIEVRELDVVRVYGKADAERVFELLGRRGEVSSNDERLCATFAQALLHYRAREWRDAQAAFTACLDIRPGDGPSAVYLTRLAAFAVTPPADDWDGVWEAHQK